MAIILSDESAGRHQTPAGHPERAERYEAVITAMSASGLPVEDAPAASRDALALVHSTPYLDTVSYTHLRAHETKANLVCRLLLEKKKK